MILLSMVERPVHLLLRLTNVATDIFERMSRKKDDHEIVNYFIANFTSHDDPGKVWIGEIIENGETNFKDWQRRNQSMSYIFGNEVESIFTRDNFDSYFHTQR